MKIYRSFSSADTKQAGANLAKKVLRGTQHRGAAVVALTGDLGSGKTTFIQGFLRGLGIWRGGTSPTFILMRRHALRRKKFRSVYHIDAYRIKKPNELLRLGFKEALTDPQNLVLIEWADKIKKILPKIAFFVGFRHGKKENERIIWYH